MALGFHILDRIRHSVPWVTKLPKLRPTMQCQVGPFLSSNCGGPVSAEAHKNTRIRVAGVRFS